MSGKKGNLNERDIEDYLSKLEGGWLSEDGLDDQDSDDKNRDADEVIRVLQEDNDDDDVDETADIDPPLVEPEDQESSHPSTSSNLHKQPVLLDISLRVHETAEDSRVIVCPIQFLAKRRRQVMHNGDKNLKAAHQDVVLDDDLSSALSRRCSSTNLRSGCSSRNQVMERSRLKESKKERNELYPYGLG
ncbi:hypothetical protein FQA39_LY06561 [Lamprigera yunnana]|nr:hypothetical protein FQA39_LY06561 [Lamprigera yunnana]